MRKFVDCRFWSREKIPPARLSLQSLRVAAQNCRRVFPWINTKGHQMHIRFFQRLLQLAHSAADHWTRPWAGCVNEIGDLAFAGEPRCTKRLTEPSGELNCGMTSVR